MCPPAVIGAAFVGMGATAAAGAAVTAIVTSVYVGAAIGAVIGAVGAAITGGDILEGALKGAVIGGVTRGIGTGLGIAAEGATAVEGVSAGVGNVPAGLQATGAEIGQISSAAGQTAGSAAAIPSVATAAPTGGGIISGVGNWINQNPTQAMMLGQTVGGAAKGISDNRAADKELKSAMERDQLYIQSKKVSGLSMLELKTALPSIGAFTETPKWQMPGGGLIKEAQNATA